MHQNPLHPECGTRMLTAIQKRASYWGDSAMWFSLSYLLIAYTWEIKMRMYNIPLSSETQNREFSDITAEWYRLAFGQGALDFQHKILEGFYLLSFEGSAINWFSGTVWIFGSYLTQPYLGSIFFPPQLQKLTIPWWLQQKEWTSI
jgi:hypothetical protein